MEDLVTRLAPASLWLAILWCVESFATTHAPGRFRHGLLNLSLAGINGLLLFFTFSAMSIWVCTVSPSVAPVRFTLLHAVACFFLLDLFSYIWHRLNHGIPILWRIHSVHHSDDRMDVTTAGRFHAAELAMGAVLRLPVLYALGVTPATLLAYETTLVVVSMFHHARLSLGRYDRFVRIATASPLMHSIHHSSNPADFGSNFSSVFSIWDRLFATLRLTDKPLAHGLDGVRSQSLGSMLGQPFVDDQHNGS